MFGDKHQLMPAWSSLSTSPIITLFGWSSLAHSAFSANRHLFAPAPLISSPYVAAPTCLHCVDPYAPLPGLLALHIRRGDFLEHCENLGQWSASFNAFNAFDGFPDPWTPPHSSTSDKSDRMALYSRRCKPSIPQIVDKVEEARRSSAGRGLKDVYVMTNADPAWLDELKAALRAQWGGWERIATARDLRLTWEEKYVSQTMDMLVGQRAQVFIGNGVSEFCECV